MLFSISNATAATVDYVYDGDTVEITDAAMHYKLRISDIDAPEFRQAFGKKAKRALIKFCQNSEAQVFIIGFDKYQRRLGKLQCNQQDVSHFMVKNGYAWFYEYYSNDLSLAKAEDHARKNKLGLWHLKKPVAPWIWREKHPHPKAK